MAETASPSSRAGSPPVPFSVGRGLAVFAVYAVVSLIVQLVSGVDYDELSASASSVFKFVILSVGGGIVAVLLLTARWGWRDAVFFDRPSLSSHRWLWAIPVLFGVIEGIGLVTTPWGDWDASIVILLLIGCLMVGFGEEIVFRGYVLIGARARYSETGAWFVSTLAFSLFHGVNILSGQSVGTTVQQMVFAFVLGSSLYLIRRVSGTLVLGMLLHGLWDFSTFVKAGPGDAAVKTDALSALATAIPLYLLVGFTIVGMFKVVGRHSKMGTPGNGAVVGA